MLVLTRKINEAILIGDTRVTVVALKNGQVRLGIEASPDVHILREELLAGGLPLAKTRVGVGASVTGTPPSDPFRPGR